MKKLEDYISTPYHYRNRKNNVITDLDEFNEIVEFCQSFPIHHSMTINKCIQKNGPVLDGWFCEDDAVESKNSFHIGCILAGNIYSFIFYASERERTKKVTGLDAFNMFKAECRKIAYPWAESCNEVIKEIKDTEIEKAWIKLNDGKLYSWSGRELANVHHIDRHSAWPASLCEAHPEFYEYFHGLYEKKEAFEGPSEENVYKWYLNYAIGAMQSLKFRGYRYPRLARDAINGNNRWMEMMTKRLERNKFTVIAYNTDGIFYADFRNPNRLYHDELEGDDMGQWCHDHHFEKIRFKSAGAYEYIENGKYHAVVRGIPKEISETFVWGDIYIHHPKKYAWTDDKSKIICWDFDDEILSAFDEE